MFVRAWSGGIRDLSPGMAEGVYGRAGRWVRGCGQASRGDRHLVNFFLDLSSDHVSGKH